MARRVHVRLEPQRVSGGVREVGAEVQWPLRVLRPWKGPRRQRVWIRVPADLDVPPEAAADAFLLGTVFRASRLGARIHVHGTVTEDLLRNLPRLMALWRERRPDRYKVREIAADHVVRGGPAGGPALLCFSGGLDSAYSLYRLSDPARAPGEPGLGAALMLQGADIPHDEDAAFEVAFERSRRMAESRGVPLLRASTNLRVVKQDWTHSSLATLAATLTLFRSRFGRGLVSPGFTEAEARVWWPQDLTDPPLLSSRAFPVEGHGYEADRFEKLVAIRDWPEAMQNLRVCFREGHWTGNCGDCLKCHVVGFFALIACGSTPPCFPRPLGLDDVERMCATKDRNLQLRMSQMVRHAHERGYDAPWLRAVEAALATRAAPEPPS